MEEKRRRKRQKEGKKEYEEKKGGRTGKQKGKRETEGKVKGGKVNRRNKDINIGLKYTPSRPLVVATRTWVERNVSKQALHLFCIVFT